MKQARVLKNVSSKIPVSRFLDYKAYLEAVYQAMKTEMDSYSYMQFAEDLGFARSNVMYLIIKGQRPLTTKTGRKIAEALELKAGERKYFDDLVAYFDSDLAPEREVHLQNMVKQKTRTIAGSDELMAQLEYFTEWYHVAIYEFSFTPHFTDDPQELAAALIPRIRLDQAKKSLALLQKLGLLALDPESKKLKPTQARVATGHEIMSMALVRYHQKILELAKQALMTISVEEREISATSMAIAPERMPRIKKEIRNFRKKIMDLAAQDPEPERVYQLSLQLFPMTRKQRTEPT
jgi:uncharacterized protein (TIGR02147 family)